MKRCVRATGLVIACVVLLAAPGCSNDDSIVINPRPEIVGSGNIVTEDRAVGAFDSIDTRFVAQISISRSGSQAVQIEADDNIIDHLSATVTGGVLVLDSDVSYRSTHGVFVTIAMTDLESIRLSGVGDITVAPGFTPDTLNVTLSGVGDIDAESVPARVCTVVLSGIGDCRVTATEQLNVTLSGTGNVHYAGNPPDVNSTITGIGSLIRI